MSKPWHGSPDYTVVEDWMDIQLLGHEPMSEVQTKLWAAMVVAAHEGDVETLLKLYKNFELIDHPNSTPHVRLAFTMDRISGLAVKGCQLTHYGLAL